MNLLIDQYRTFYKSDPGHCVLMTLMVTFIPIFLIVAIVMVYSQPSWEEQQQQKRMRDRIDCLNLGGMPYGNGCYVGNPPRLIGQ